MAQIIARHGNELTIQVKVNIEGSLLDAEDMIQNACNEVGLLATEEALKSFDTDGSSLETGGIKWTAKPPSEKKYQTPYGVVEIKRYTIKLQKVAKFGAPWKNEYELFAGEPPG